MEFIQLVDFPTRDGNALDLVFTVVVGNHSARPVPELGSSDHLALRISLDLKSTIPDPVSRAPVRMWCAAPWGNIGGELHKALKHWDPDAFGCVDNVVQDFNMICDQLISKHVALAVPTQRSMMPWWNKSCNNAYMAKLVAFEARSTDPDAYKRAVRRCSKANRVAYKK